MLGNNSQAHISTSIKSHLSCGDSSGSRLCIRVTSLLMVYSAWATTAAPQSPAQDTDPYVCCTQKGTQWMALGGVSFCHPMTEASLSTGRGPSTDAAQPTNTLGRWFGGWQSSLQVLVTPPMSMLFPRYGTSSLLSVVNLRRTWGSLSPPDCPVSSVDCTAASS